jgi:hypothetical protein
MRVGKLLCVCAWQFGDVSLISTLKLSLLSELHNTCVLDPPPPPIDFSVPKKTRKSFDNDKIKIHPLFHLLSSDVSTHRMP